MKIEIVDGNIVVVIPCNKETFAKAQPSKSGKTRTLATTNGFTGIMTPAGNVKLSLNASVPL